MFKRAIVVAVILPAMGAGAWFASPALRAKISQQWTQVSGWTEEARQADPVGFASYAEGKLKQDLVVMQKTRRQLAGEIGQLASKLREQEAMAAQARQMAGQFRTEYQLASTGGSFPIEVRGAAYTEPQVRSQVSMLLAEAEGYEESLEGLRQVRQQAEEQMEELAVRVNATEAQLATLSTKRELLRAQQLTAEGEQLLAQVDELMTGNAQVIEGNPVRTVRELVSAPTGKVEKPASRSRVDEFLAAKPDAQVEGRTVSFEERVEQVQATPESATKVEKKESKREPAKPIFTQS